MDKRIGKKIDELVEDGIKNVKEIERFLNHYVKTDLYRGKELPSKHSRRFFPEVNDIRNRVTRANRRIRHSKIDQHQLQIKIEEWEKNLENKFFYRPFKEGEEENENENVQMFFNERGDFIGEVLFCIKIYN